jgi:hypothetical protein
MSKAYASAGDTVSIAATTASANVAIFGNSNVGYVVNIGTVPTHIAFGGTVAVAATTADMVLGPNESRPVQKGGATFMAARTASGTATIYFTPVE